MEYNFSKEDLKEYLKNGDYADFISRNAPKYADFISNKVTQLWLDNIDVLLESIRFQSFIVEVRAADNAGSVFVNEVGYDEFSKDNLRIETKFTNYIKPTGELRINSAGENKYGRFDVIRIVDGINKRIFEIPHDKYFNEGKFYGNEFLWSSSYNSSDRKQVGNTQLLLKYETTDK